MKLYTIDTGNFKLDGGAMFGVVPKSIWNKLNPSDENNMCNWAMRCLLIEDGDKLILIDNGLGNKQDAKFFSYYYLHGDATLDGSLAKHGFHKDDITDVILTHLHFDHCGGSINLVDGKLVPAFKNATFWSNGRHWNWATKPNDREKASFLKENILPIQEHGHLKFVPDEEGYQLFDNINIRFVNGHTDAMMLPQVNYKGKTIVYISDENEILGLIAMKDVLRKESVEAIRELNMLGIQTIMITGDNEQTAHAIASESSITEYYASCLPETKVQTVKALKEKYGSVAMVGDGINDAPALATASVGIAMGEGTDVALETADVVLMKNELSRLAQAIRLSRRMNTIVKQNIIFSLSVIALLICSNFFQALALPLGVIGHEGSTILVILNGLRLLQANK